MTVLIDTHILLWWLTRDARLPSSSRSLISSPTINVLVSAATVWEMAIKANLGKLTFPEDLESQLFHNGFQEVPITVADALAAGELPRHHNDPFDRMLIAQAIRRDLPLVSVDHRFEDYPVRLLR